MGKQEKEGSFARIAGRPCLLPFHESHGSPPAACSLNTWEYTHVQCSEPRLRKQLNAVELGQAF